MASGVDLRLQREPIANAGADRRQLKSAVHVFLIEERGDTKRRCRCGFGRACEACLLRGDSRRARRRRGKDRGVAARCRCRCCRPRRAHVGDEGTVVRWCRSSGRAGFAADERTTRRRRRTPSWRILHLVRRRCQEPPAKRCRSAWRGRNQLVVGGLEAAAGEGAAPLPSLKMTAGGDVPLVVLSLGVARPGEVMASCQARPKRGRGSGRRQAQVLRKAEARKAAARKAAGGG